MINMHLLIRALWFPFNPLYMRLANSQDLSRRWLIRIKIIVLLMQRNRQMQILLSARQPPLSKILFTPLDRRKYLDTSQIVEVAYLRYTRNIIRISSPHLCWRIPNPALWWLFRRCLWSTHHHLFVYHSLLMGKHESSLALIHHLHHHEHGAHMDSTLINALAVAFKGVTVPLKHTSCLRRSPKDLCLEDRETPEHGSFIVTARPVTHWPYRRSLKRLDLLLGPLALFDQEANQCARIPTNATWPMKNATQPTRNLRISQSLNQNLVVPLHP